MLYQKKVSSFGQWFPGRIEALQYRGSMNFWSYVGPNTQTNLYFKLSQNLSNILKKLDDDVDTLLTSFQNYILNLKYFFIYLKNEGKVGHLLRELIRNIKSCVEDTNRVFQNEQLTKELMQL